MTHDLIELFLTEKRCESTRRAYLGDLGRFFDGDLSQGRVGAFLAGDARGIVKRLVEYKSEQIRLGMKENTLNRRLAVVRSFLRFACRMDRATCDGKGAVDGERVQIYRDTRGIRVSQMRELLRLPESARDLAMLRLLVENGLRRNEVVSLDVPDFDFHERLVLVTGKGKGTQKVRIALSRTAAEAVQVYLAEAGHTEGPLFRNVARDPSKSGGRLTGSALYAIVAAYGAQIGLRLTPHKLRHSCITAALEATDGDVRRVQRLSRHASLNTLMIYDDARRDSARGVVDLLSGLLE